MRKLLYLMLLMMGVACSSIDCPVENVVSTQYQVLDTSGTKLKLTDTLTVVSKRLDGKDTSLLDPTLYNKGINISEFSLPISYSHPEDILLFHFDNTVISDSVNINLHVVDTVWVQKVDLPHFESVDCNSSFFHELTGVHCTHNYIDSIVIKNTSVTYDAGTVHFLLYPKISH